MKPVILMRCCLADDGELEVAKKYFDVYECITDIPRNSLVIPRYACLPYFRELAYNINNLGSKLINSYGSFAWISEFKWYWSSPELRKITPKTWREDEFYTAEEGRFVVKGVTNSKKQNWNTSMYASTKRKAVEIGCLLYNDGLIGYQPIIYREYIPLKTFDVLLNDLPVTNEHRIFVLNGHILCNGYYWSNAENTDVKLSEEGLTFAENVINMIGGSPKAYSFDIAEKESGGWTLIEINSFEMAGLSCISPEEFYKTLSERLK